MLTAVSAAVGFSLITLALTYVMSVYGALNRRDAAALALHQRTGDTGDAAMYLAGLLSGPPAFAARDLAALPGDLARLFEAHRSCPVLLYFRPPEVRYATPRVLFVALDAAALIRSATVDGEETPAEAIVEAVRLGGLRPVRELAPLFLPGRSSLSADARIDHDRWRARYDRAAAALRAAGVACRDDDAGFAGYAERRAEWDRDLRRFAEFLRYDWLALTAGGANSRVDDPTQATPDIP